MYRYYNKDGKNIMEYDFDSIAEFIDYLDNAPLSAQWDSSSIFSDFDDYEYFKTHSLQEAKDLCKFGYHENFEKLVELKLKLDKYIKMSSKKTKQYNFYVGYAPDVKAYLEGNPLNMFNKQNPERKHIDIYYNSAVLNDVSSDKIFNRGVITLSLVEMLENMGFSVGLNVFAMSERDGQIHYAKFNIKRKGERLNIQKLFFPLCNPSFLRRLVCRLREVTPDITSGWIGGYGIASNDYTIRKTIGLKENDIVICQPDEMGIKGHNIVEDANAMFDYLNQSFDKEDVLQRIKIPQKSQNEIF